MDETKERNTAVDLLGEKEASAIGNILGASSSTDPTDGPEKRESKGSKAEKILGKQEAQALSKILDSPSSVEEPTIVTTEKNEELESATVKQWLLSTVEGLVETIPEDERLEAEDRVYTAILHSKLGAGAVITEETQKSLLVVISKAIRGQMPKDLDEGDSVLYQDGDGEIRVSKVLKKKGNKLRLHTGRSEVVTDVSSVTPVDDLSDDVFDMVLSDDCDVEDVIDKLVDSQEL